GFIVLGLEGELRVGSVLPGPDELELEFDPVVRVTFGHRYDAFADVVVAGPLVGGVLSWGPFNVHFGIAIEFKPRGPGAPFVEVVHLLKHLRRRSVDRGGPRDAVIGRHCCNERGQDTHDDAQRKNEFRESDETSSRWGDRWVMSPWKDSPQPRIPKKEPEPGEYAQDNRRVEHGIADTDMGCSGAAQKGRHHDCAEYGRGREQVEDS